MIAHPSVMTNRNEGLDALKFVAAVLIVLLHVDSPWHEWILPLTRCAVPVFFMISGYFLYDASSEKFSARIRRQIPKILRITIWATLLFSIIPIAKCLYLGDFTSIVNTKVFVNWVLFNESPFGFHLWYLWAYVYVLLIALVFCRFKCMKMAFILIPILLAGDLLLGKYSLLVFGRTFDFLWCRNFLFVGLPYFFLGALIKRISDKAKCNPLINSYLCVWGG